MLIKKYGHEQVKLVTANSSNSGTKRNSIGDETTEEEVTAIVPTSTAVKTPKKRKTGDKELEGRLLVST